jgi:hypothetical protein
MDERPETLESWLHAVRRGLKGLPSLESDEAIQELRSHVLDRLAGDPSPEALADALASLGDPAEVARANLALRVAGAAAGRRSPLAVLGAIARLTSLSLYGLWVGLVSLVGYGLAGSWLFVAIAKPFAPQHVGFWLLSSTPGDLSFSLGGEWPIPKGHEVLGWSVIPIGIVLGLGFGWLTYLYDRHAIRRMARPRLRAEQAPAWSV